MTKKQRFSYAELFEGSKQEIISSKIKAILSVNKQLFVLYWKLGKRILDQQIKEGWRSKVIDRLSTDLKKEFPIVSQFGNY
jgi:predicted nuclease of restriction endonuclease-like (RecB) superfamily